MNEQKPKKISVADVASINAKDYYEHLYKKYFDLHDKNEKTSVKHDTGKASWHLMPFDALQPILSVLAYGRDKYGARNWEMGMDWNRLFDAAIRHLAAWQGGENKDRESGFSHLAHAACNILFLIAYQIRNVGHDSRTRSDDRSSY